MKDLASSQSYDFQVRAIDSDGSTSPYSATGTAFTARHPKASTNDLGKCKAVFLDKAKRFESGLQGGFKIGDAYVFGAVTDTKNEYEFKMVYVDADGKAKESR